MSTKTEKLSAFVWCDRCGKPIQTGTHAHVNWRESREGPTKGSRECSDIYLCCACWRAIAKPEHLKQHPACL